MCRGGGEETSTRTHRSSQVQAAWRLTALLLHVWIDIIIMVESYKGVLHVNLVGYRPRLKVSRSYPGKITSLSTPNPSLILLSSYLGLSFGFFSSLVYLSVLLSLMARPSFYRSRRHPRAQGEQRGFRREETPPRHAEEMWPLLLHARRFVVTINL